MGGSGAKVFMITGTKVESNVTITTVEERGRGLTAQIRIDMPVASMTVGPKGSHEASHSENNMRSIGGPIVFAFQVKKFRVNRKGKVLRRKHIDGAMLSRTKGALVIECAGERLHDNEIDNFDLEVRPGINAKTGDACDIIIP